LPIDTRFPYTTLFRSGRARRSDSRGRGVSAIVIDNIGVLVTNDPAFGDGPLGTRRQAALVVDDGRVLAVGAAGQLDADSRFDARSEEHTSELQSREKL